jgi:TatD DNase family protein
MQLFDTHFHYYPETSPQEYYDKISRPELTRLLAVGANYVESLNARKFAEAIENSWFAAGVHPHSATDYLAAPETFDEFSEAEKMVAVGEIGLDFFYETSIRSDQYQVMEQFLNYALEWKRPAIIHCRDKDDCDNAYQDCYSMLRDFSGSGGRFVVHSFTGTTSWADKFLELGAFIGVNGIVTFPRAQNVRDLLSIIPDERLLLETDSPYLAPVPHRGKTNHPGLIIHVAEKIAELKQLSVEQVATMTSSNGCKFFL